MGSRTEFSCIIILIICVFVSYIKSVISYKFVLKLLNIKIDL